VQTAANGGGSAPAQPRSGVRFPARVLEQLESVFSLDYVVIRVRPAPDVGLAGEDVRERELAAVCQQHPCKRDRIPTDTVSINSDEDVPEHFVFLLKSS